MKNCRVLLALALLAATANARQDTAPVSPQDKAPVSSQDKAPVTTQEKLPTSKESVAEKTAAAFPAEQLEQIVAPIALYPDSLLAQILMASTYPLEVVEAARWVQKNPKVTGDKLEAALKEMTWDPSVKSLCGFPDVLKRMNENLDWTQDLGDAFLGQQAELMEAVQQMRRKAYESGNLKSSKELTVTEQEDKIIVIQAAQPEVVYVPTYYPTAVYGSWGYPYYYYPPMYPPPPAGGAFFGFTAGVIWGAAIWGDCDWNDAEIDIDVDHYHEFVDRTENTERRQEVKERAGTTDRAGTTNRGPSDRTRPTAGTSDRAGKSNWQHNPEHRKGVGYKDGKVAQQYGAGPGQTRVSRDQARGYGGSATQRPTSGASARTSPSQRTSPSTRSSTSQRTAGQASHSSRTTGQRSSSFSGSRSPSFDRASSSRGSVSRGSLGSRGGGGRGGRR